MPRQGTKAAALPEKKSNARVYMDAMANDPQRGGGGVGWKKPNLH
jgi:hypothetical protein